MRFVRFGQPGAERPGVLVDEDEILDISPLVADLGPPTLDRLSELAAAITTAPGLSSVSLDEVRLGSPVARPHKILGIGLNYADHATEAGMELPDEPVVFSKATSSLSGPFDDIRLPASAEKVDWEVELGVVVGRLARHLPDESAAEDAIAGYTIAHDVSERSYQLERGGQWIKGKSADTFCPTGPWLVTPDEIGDVTNLELHCRVNGVPMQSGSTATMIFTPRHIVWYLSQFLTLEPGDLILTGTPPGVGMASGTYLEDGDIVELEVTGLGIQRQACRRLAK
jgi:2,4-diketo-3-deoxy-L-fuconate hydrolase